MKRPIVVYTDPPWALRADGTVDHELAVVEREVFGDTFELRLGPTDSGRYLTSGESFRRVVDGASALAIYRCRITPELLDLVGSGLIAVARQGVGYDNLAPELLKRRGILGFNIPDYCVDEVAAHTMALALALERGIVAQHVGLSSGRFDIYAGGPPRRLRRQTAGIVGFGRIGRAVAARLRLFYGEVLAYDPYVSADLMEAYGASHATFEELLERSELVTLHCVLSDETRGMLDERAFALMRPTAFLVNAARGAIVDARALHDALAEQRLAGAGIDVFSPENPHDDPWYSRVVTMPNVVVTSHRAYLSTDSELSQRRRTAEGLRTMLESGRPPSVGVLTNP